jgi:sugar phosphate isomerase/epimerase
MFTCNSTWSFHRLMKKEQQEVDIMAFPAICAKLGIDAVELLDFHFDSKSPKYMDQVKAACKKAKVKLHCFAISNDMTYPYGSPERKEQITNVKKAIKYANYLEAPVMRVFCGTQSVTDAAIDRVITAYQECMVEAEKNNVVLAMENHWGLSVNPDNVIKIIKGVYCPKYFGSCLDFGNWQPLDQLDAARRVAPFAKHTHGKSYVFTDKGDEKNIDFKEIIKSLKQAGYEGAVSVEFEGEGDEIEGTEKTVKLIKKYI